MDQARSSTLVGLIILEIVGAFSFRSFRKSSLGRSLFTNKYLVYASIVSIILTILALYTPLNKVIETVPISLKNWFLVIILSILFMILFDLFKRAIQDKKFLKEL
jgi:Ca2+-transporting ATPase